MSIRIVTDSSCDLPQGVVDAHGISVVPLSIRFGEQEYIDREQLTTAEFWAKCATSATLPETAAPAPGQFEQVYRSLAAEGATGIVVVSLSGALSATMQSAELAARSVTDVVPVRVVDSRSVTLGVGTMAIACAQRAAAGGTLDEVAALATDLAARTKVFGALDTLENLKKGGRIGGAQAMLGSMLSIKPIIDITGGKVEQEAKQRTRSKSLRYLAEKVGAQPGIENLAVMHGDAPDVEEMLDLLAPHFPREKIVVGDLGAVIGAHGGPRTMGVTFQLSS